MLSLPPIINSEATKISVNTKNVFIELTATDKTRGDVCCAILTSQFSQYCENPNTIELINVVDIDGTTSEKPVLDNVNFEVELDYVRKVLGIDINVA